jgi:hypothetical protein
MQWQMEPLPHWTYLETRGRHRSPFTAGWSDTLRLLERELRHLGVTGVVAIRVCAAEQDIRRDGMLRASAKPWHPGVALSFVSRYGALTYPCDTYSGTVDMPGWQANMRAITLSLAALRAVDRHGVAGRGEQYAGWRRIEAAGSPAMFTSADEALVFLRGVLNIPGVEGLSNKMLVRSARSTAHPDRHGGDRALWDQVEIAVRVIGEV